MAVDVFRNQSSFANLRLLQTEKALDFQCRSSAKTYCKIYMSLLICTLLLDFPFSTF